jgi:allantoin racemase
VIGIAEAAMRMAAVVASRFGIVTTVAAAVPGIEILVNRYGAAQACAGVRAAGVKVLALERPTAIVYRRLRDTAARLVRVDRADAIVLGCAGMSAIGPRLARDLGVPVVDGVGSAVKFAEGLLALGLSTGKRPPRPAPTVKRRK